MSKDNPSRLAHLGSSIKAGVVGSVLTAVAGSIALVALALALDAELLVYLTPAVASAATAGVFAMICGVLAMVTPKLIAGSARPTPASDGLKVNPVALGVGIEIALAVAAGVAEASRRRRKPQRVADR